MANKTVRTYPAFIRPTPTSPTMVVGVNATSIMEAHEVGKKYCEHYGYYLSAVGMPQA